MADRPPITRANYDVAALTQYLDEQCAGRDPLHCVFVLPFDASMEPEHLKCTRAQLFNILLPKQETGRIVYVEIDDGIFCVPAGTPDMRLDPPVTISYATATEIAAVSKDTKISEWIQSAKVAKAARVAKSAGGAPRGRRTKSDAPEELIPPLGAAHVEMLLRRGWTQTMVDASGLGTIVDAEVLAALGPRGGAASPYALAIPYGEGRRVQLEVPDMGDRAALERASIWDRTSLSPYVPAPVLSDGRLAAASADPLVVVFDELDAHVLAELGHRVIGAERLEALRVRVEGVESLHPKLMQLVDVRGGDVLIVGYPAVPGRRLLEARRAGKWLYDAGASRVRFLGLSHALVAECLPDPGKWHTLERKAVSLERDVCGEPYTTLRDALPPDVAAESVFQGALNLYVPEGYDIDPVDGSVSVVRPSGYANGVEMTKQVLVMRSVIVPIARVVTAQPLTSGGESTGSGEESLESCIIAHRRDTGWALLHVPMRTLSTKQGAVQLREFGIAASEHNALELVAWFHHFLEINTLHVRVQVQPRYTELGWHKTHDDGLVFAMPGVTSGQYAAAPALVTASSAALEGYGTRGGSRDAQYAVLRKATKHPALRFAVTEVFRSMLVPLLGGNRSRCIHFYGTTTTGKSLGLYTAMNIYGKGQQIEIKGSSTMTGLERQMAARNHTTIYVDDILHKTAEEREALLYMASDGRGKTRATKDAEVRRTVRWVAGLITSGEKPLQDEGMAQGAQARVFELELTQLEPELVTALMDGLHHYGHVIYDWLALSDKIHACVPKYTCMLRDLTVELRDAARAKGVNPRTSDLMAEILVTHAVLVEVGIAPELGLPNDGGTGLREMLYGENHLQAEVRPEHAEAYDALQSFMLANRHQIVAVNDPTPRAGVVARLTPDLSLLVEKRWLHKFLQKEGFNSRNVIQKWTADRTVGSTQRKIADGRPKFYHFRAAEVIGTQADHVAGYASMDN